MALANTLPGMLSKAIPQKLFANGSASLLVQWHEKLILAVPGD